VCETLRLLPKFKSRREHKLKSRAVQVAHSLRETYGDCRHLRGQIAGHVPAPEAVCCVVHLKEYGGPDD
jgi:hypothetical protein